MNINQIKTKTQNLNQIIRDNISDFENEIYPITDGVFNLEEYYNNKNIRIAWLMKEAYEDEREGDWSIPDLYFTDYEKFYKSLVTGKSKTTWQPAIYATYGIVNEFIEWDDIPFIRNQPSIVKSLDNIAWINIQKLPSETRERTKINNIHNSYQKNKKYLFEQIELCNPELIICGNTLPIIQKDLEIIEEGKYEGVEYCKTKNRIYINAYHPGQRSITREVYVNEIIRCAKMLL